MFSTARPGKVALPVRVSCVLNRKFRRRVSTELVDKAGDETRPETLRLGSLGLTHSLLPNVVWKLSSMVAQLSPLNGAAEPCNRRLITEYSLTENLHLYGISKLCTVFIG